MSLGAAGAQPTLAMDGVGSAGAAGICTALGNDSVAWHIPLCSKKMPGVHPCYLQGFSWRSELCTARIPSSWLSKPTCRTGVLKSHCQRHCPPSPSLGVSKAALGAALPSGKERNWVVSKVPSHPNHSVMLRKDCSSRSESHPKFGLLQGAEGGSSEAELIKICMNKGVLFSVRVFFVPQNKGETEERLFNLGISQLRLAQERGEGATKSPTTGMERAPSINGS